MGVTIRLNSRVDDLEATMAEGRFDAAFLALGAHRPARRNSGVDAKRVLDAVTFLRDMEGQLAPS